MTADRYLEMCEQLGNEPDPEKIPPDWDDFPDIVSATFYIFNNLGDRVYPDIGYVGKDYTNLSTYFDVYGIEDKEFALEVLTFLDNEAMKKSSEGLKREHEKLKRKHSGRK